MTRDLFFVKAPLREGIGQLKGQKTPESKANVPTGSEKPQEEVIPIPGLNSTHTILSVKMPCQNTNVTQSAIAAMGIIPLTIQASQAGRLAHFQSNWEKVTKDRWVLNTVKGYEIEFSLKLHQTQKPYPAQLNQTQQELVSQEIKDMISKGAVTELQTLPVGGFLSTLFLVPKKDGGQRPVIYLKKLNSHKCPTFQDGRHSHTQKPSPKGRLASKDRPERCILFCPDKQRAQEISVSNSGTGFTSSTVSLLAWPQPHGSLPRP